MTDEWTRAEKRKAQSEQAKAIMDFVSMLSDKINELEKENAELKADNDARKFAMTMSEKVEKQLREQIEKMKKYGKLLQDICTVMGNDPYMVSVGLENRVKILWDSSEEKEGLKLVEDIENRLLKIKPQEWAEITKWEIKENDIRRKSKRVCK